MLQDIGHIQQRRIHDQELRTLQHLGCYEHILIVLL